MKLYAIVTSERASKGQGGNEIIIDVTANNKTREPVMSIRIVYEGDKAVIKRFWLGNIDSKVLEDFVAFDHLDRSTKGEKKKGEWIFNHGGECNSCHRGEVTELNNQSICKDCF